MSRLPTLLLMIGFVSSINPSTASAQTVYRCGANGNQYSQQPCADGRAVDVSDSRSPGQAAEARAAVREQQRVAADMATQRRAEEAAHRPALAGGISLRREADAKLAKARDKRPTKARASHRKGSRSDSAYRDDSADFVAIAPGSGAKKKKRQD